MAKYMIAKQLVGKKVVTSDGYDVGRFVDAEISPVTGKLNVLYVEPNPDSGLANKFDVENGQIKIPYAAVQAVNDYIMVDRKNL